MSEENEIICELQENRTVVAIPFDYLAFCHLFLTVTVNNEGRTKRTKRVTKSLSASPH